MPENANLLESIQLWQSAAVVVLEPVKREARTITNERLHRPKDVCNRWPRLPGRRNGSDRQRRPSRVQPRGSLYGSVVTRATHFERRSASRDDLEYDFRRLRFERYGLDRFQLFGLLRAASLDLVQGLALFAKRLPPKPFGASRRLG